MKLWVQYISQLDADKKLLNIYRKLREEFRKEEWSEEDLESPPYYTHNIMSLYHAFQKEKINLEKEINSYFGEIELSDYMKYIESKMKEINDETPLKKKKKRKS